MSQIIEQATPPASGTVALDELDRDRTRRHTLIWIVGLAVLMLLTLPVATGLGPVGIALGRAAGRHRVGDAQAIAPARPAAGRQHHLRRRG